jgi:hypothetical protein
MEMKRNRLEIDDKNIVSRRDYQEILLARMAGGDLYANELRMKIRRIDIALDKFREKPIYKESSESPSKP